MSKDDVTDVNFRSSENGDDPTSEMDVVLEMKVKDVNVLLALLAELPFKNSANVINVIRADVIRQVQEKLSAQKD